MDTDFSVKIEPENVNDDVSDLVGPYVHVGVVSSKSVSINVKSNINPKTSMGLIYICLGVAFAA